MTVLADSFAECRAITRAHASSFYFASHVLPKERREAAYAIYAFCRGADDAVDLAPTPADALRQLDEVRARVDDVYRGADTGFKPDVALANVVRRYGLPRSSFEGLLDGMAIDLQPVAFESTEELLRYCHLAAGVVGELLLPVLGASGEHARDRADALGIAMQLTNILRDVGEDLGRDRIYLPAAELAAFGLSHEDVRARRQDEQWASFMRWQIARARRWYAHGLAGTALIQTWGGRLCARLMGTIYGDILRTIEQRSFDVFGGRARVGTSRKVALLMGALVGWTPLLAGRELLPLRGRTLPQTGVRS